MKLFEEVLPIGAEINASTIRNHTLAVAEKLESELGDEQVFFIEGCERDWEELPRPEMPLTVGIDGGYVDSCVNSYDTKPKRRVFEVLKSQGMQMNQQITFLKKQQMSWSRRGAHLLLQVRTRVLNEELRGRFDSWYPGLVGDSEECARAA